MNMAATRRARSSHGAQIWLLVPTIVVGLVAAGLAWYRVAHALSSAHPVKVPIIRPVSGVVWGGRVFESKASLENWLRLRGASYSTWAARNPALARVLATR